MLSRKKCAVAIILPSIAAVASTVTTHFVVVVVLCKLKPRHFIGHDVIDTDRLRIHVYMERKRDSPIKSRQSECGGRLLSLAVKTM